MKDDVIRKTMPDVVIIDSIQTMFCENTASAPGSVSQVRESTSVLMQLASKMLYLKFFLLQRKCQLFIPLFFP